MWKPWIEIQQNEDIKEIVQSTDKPLRWLIALTLSVAKWHPDNLNRGKPIGACGACHIAFIECLEISKISYQASLFPPCKNCILHQTIINNISICSDIHKTSMYTKARESKENKDKLYNAILEAYNKEYEKVKHLLPEYEWS